MNKQLAIFDLDGTLVSCQTQRCFLEHCRDRGYIGTVTRHILMIWFGLYKAGVISEPRKPMEYAYRFTSGWPVEKLDDEVADCVSDRILPHLNPKMMARIEIERHNGRHLLLVSNTIAPLANIIARYLKLDGCISSVLETIDCRFTGRIAGDIAYGEHKVRLVRAYVERQGLSLAGSVIYADHISDLPLLEIATTPVAVNPCRNLRPLAEAMGWEIVSD